MKISFILFVVFCTLYSFSQMKVEDIKSEADVLSFVRQEYVSKNPSDSIVSFEAFAKEQQEDSNFFKRVDRYVYHYVDSIKAPKYLINDFNKDGTKDLVVCMFFNDDNNIMFFCSQNGGGYKPELLSLKTESYISHFIQYNYSTSNLIIAAIDDTNTDYDSSYKFSDKIRLDTVAYRNGRFIDYDYDENRNLSIDTIQFDLLSSLSRNHPRIVIPKIGKTLLFLSHDSKNDSAYLFEDVYEIITADTFNNVFFKTAQSINFNKYYSSYNTKGLVHDGHYIRTELRFSNGTKKIIKDRLESGPFGLRVLYGYFKELLKSQERKLIYTQKSTFKW